MTSWVFAYQYQQLFISLLVTTKTVGVIFESFYSLYVSPAVINIYIRNCMKLCIKLCGLSKEKLLITT